MGILGTGILGSGSKGHPLMNVLNFALRVCQLILALAALGLYASYLSFENSHFFAHEHSPVTAVVASVLTIVTAIVFGLLPIFTSNYFHVAVCFLWDFVLFCLWCAVFGLFHNEFITQFHGATPDEWHQATPKAMIPQIQNMMDAVWVDLVLLLLFLTTTIAGIVGLCVGRRGRRTSRV